MRLFSFIFVAIAAANDVDDLLQLPEDQNIIELRDKYCAMHPATCAPTLNCFFDPPLKPEWQRWHSQLATPDGRPNLKTLCFANDFEDSLIQHCLVNKDPVKSAELMFAKQQREGSTEFTASYCFMEGHCDRETVQPTISLEDGESHCNARYGKEWQTIGLDVLPERQDIGNSIHTKFTGMRACAMGFYHCDMVMCQEQYCNRDEFKSKYAKPMPKGPVTQFIQLSARLPEDQNIIELRDKYCAMHPATCAPTLNCFFDPPLKPEWIRWHSQLATPDGRPNLKTLCFANDFEDSLIQHCLVNKDPVKSGELMFAKQTQEGSADFTASYCFMEGHCDREKVESTISLEDGEKLCNQKYGDEWQKIGLDVLPQSNAIANPVHTKFTGMRACAMAFYHCDAVMCQEQYCNKEEFKTKYQL